MIQGIHLPGGLVPRAPANMPKGSVWRQPRWVTVSVWSMFAAIWIGLGIVLITSPESIEEMWSWIGGLPTLIQVAIWIVFLPVMIAVAVLQTDWEPWVQIGVFVLCVTWTTVGFLPDRVAREQRSGSGGAS